MFEKDRNVFILPNTDMTPVWEAFRKQNKINKKLAVIALVTLICVISLSKEVDKLDRQVRKLKNGEGESKCDD